jgi:hypothetical protein
MWPSWVFGVSGFPSDRLPQLTLPSQKGNQWAPIGWGLPGIINSLIAISLSGILLCVSGDPLCASTFLGFPETQVGSLETQLGLVDVPEPEPEPEPEPNLFGHFWSFFGFFHGQFMETIG